MESEMPNLSGDADEARVPDQVSVESLSSAVFELLWGHERIALPTVVDYAYEQIWKLLVFGEDRSEQREQRLSDVTLSEKLGVSRTPVRQALERLVKDGLVRADPRRGFWSRVFTAQDIREIYDLRGALEVLALRLAAPHLTSTDLQTQLTTLNRVRRLLEGGQEPVTIFLESDFRLHTLFIRASNNARLIDYLATLRSQYSIYQVKDTSYPQRMGLALDEHEKILLALLNHNIEMATSFLAAHISRAKAHVLLDIFGEK
jgi:DNA-binding GntR family transcriptional regulator